MRKKMGIIAIIVAISVLVVLGIWYFCSRVLLVGPSFLFMPIKELNSDSTFISQEELGMDEREEDGWVEDERDNEQWVEDELLAVVDSKEEAEKIAITYNLTLLSYDGMIALYHTDENPVDVINRATEEGFLGFELNYYQFINIQ